MKKETEIVVQLLRISFKSSAQRIKTRDFKIMDHRRDPYLAMNYCNYFLSFLRTIQNCSVASGIQTRIFGAEGKDPRLTKKLGHSLKG